jgi:hypothetical protein
MSSKAKQPGQARSKGGQVWRVAAGKLELVAPAGGQAGNRPALVDQSPDGLSAEWEPVHPVQGASRAERATASSSPPIVVIDDDGCIRARVPRSCHRPTPARLPGPPGFRVLLGGSWPSWATSDLGEQFPHSLEALPQVPGSGQHLLKLSQRQHGPSDGCCHVRLEGVVAVRSSNDLDWSGAAGPGAPTRLASSWAVKAMPKNSAIPVRLAHNNSATTPVSGP